MLCQDCKEKKFCSTPCSKLNKYLKDNGIYSADWIRPEISSAKKKEGKGRWREVPFSALNPHVPHDKNPFINPINEVKCG